MDIKVGVSNRHVHLSEEDYHALFGDTKVEKLKDLVQPGEFASNLVVEIETEKSKIGKVRFLGPFRSYTQVEISKTDCYTLGIDAPVRNSGDLNGAASITIVGPYGKVTKNCAIIANRHMHISKNERINLGLENIEKVKIKIDGQKSSTLEEVYIKETPNGVLELHLDTDDANANLIKTGDIVKILV